jgi:TRAP-type C4-dicarboxylate transport system permease small subunit
MTDKNSSTKESYIYFLQLMFAIIIGWILVNLWQRVIDNFTFKYLKLNQDSLYHTTIIAGGFTLLFFIFLYLFNDIFNAVSKQDSSSVV